MRLFRKGLRSFHRLTKHSSLENVFLICVHSIGEMDSHKCNEEMKRAVKYFEKLRSQGKWGSDVDGLILAWIRDSEDSPFAHRSKWNKSLPEDTFQRVAHMKLFNVDGSEAETSGNGLCCLGQAIARVLNVKKGVFQIIDEVVGFESRKEVTVENGLFDESKVKTTMGFPYFGGDKQNLDAKAVVWPLAEDAVFVDVGNPHLVALVKDLDEVEIVKHGREAEKFFGSPVNVEFVVPGSDRRSLEMEVWERGVGVTQACGTGAVASVAACKRWGLIDLGPGSDVVVKMPGGEAVVSWEESSDKELWGDKNLSTVPILYSTEVKYLGEI